MTMEEMRQMRRRIEETHRNRELWRLAGYSRSINKCEVARRYIARRLFEFQRAMGARTV